MLNWNKAIVILSSGAAKSRVAQMGWEQRGNNQYYYRKQREGFKVKSVYVGRREIAHMISQIQATSPMLEKVARAVRSPQQVKCDRADTILEEATDLIHLLTQAAYWPPVSILTIDNGDESAMSIAQAA